MRYSARLLLVSLPFAVAAAVGCSTSTPRDGQASPTNPPDPTAPGEVTSDAGTTPKVGPLEAGTVIDHILSTGQSNSIGFAAQPPLSLEPSPGNLMFDHGVMTAADCDENGCKRYEKPSGFSDLVEGDTYYADRVETMSSGMASEIGRLRSAAGEPASRLLVSVHGRSGNTYWCLSKKGCAFLEGQGYVRPFDEAMMQIADAKALAVAAGAGYTVRAVTAIHGESDHYAAQFPLDGTDGTSNAIVTYADALLEWQRDYDAAIRAATGQAETVPLFISQMANWNDTPHSEIPSRQLEAHVRSAGRVIVIGPTYQLPYAPDCIHFTNRGEKQLGEYFAKAYQRVITEHGVWEPLRPLQATAADNVVTVRFQVPKPPLVLDTQLVSNPGNYGFEMVDAAGGALVIESVTLTGADTVAITTSGASAGGRVRYAYTAQPLTCPGPETGPRGNLRDSDASTSASGTPLFDWSVSFDIPIE
jgi:hypothetical protein